MLVVVTEPCCVRGPFEGHKENCVFKREKRETEEMVERLVKEFEQALKDK